MACRLSRAWLRTDCYASSVSCVAGHLICGISIDSRRTAYRYGYKEDPDGCRNAKYLPFTLEEEKELMRRAKDEGLVRDNNCRPFKRVKLNSKGVPVRVWLATKSLSVALVTELRVTACLGDHSSVVKLLFLIRCMISY